MRAETLAKRVVVDTNVWLSAALSPTGAPSQVLRGVLAHGVPVFSDATFAELEARIWKPKFDLLAIEADLVVRIVAPAQALLMEDFLSDEN